MREIYRARGTSGRLIAVGSHDHERAPCGGFGEQIEYLLCRVTVEVPSRLISKYNAGLMNESSA